MRKVMAIALLAVVLAGCNTVPSPSEKVTTVDTEIPGGKITAERGIVSVVVDRLALPGIKVCLLVDGALVAQVKAGQRVRFGADPGTRIVTMTGCSQRGNQASIRVDVATGSTEYLRASFGENMEFAIQPAIPGYR